MTIYGGNSGYNGYSMSKRAEQARSNGKYPKTDFKKEYGLSEKLFKLFEKNKLIASYEWHHTSVYGNQTDFFEWVDEDYLAIWEEKAADIKKLARRIKKGPALRDYAATREDMERYTRDSDAAYRANKVVEDEIIAMFEEEE